MFIKVERGPEFFVEGLGPRGERWGVVKNKMNGTTNEPKKKIKWRSKIETCLNLWKIQIRTM